MEIPVYLFTGFLDSGKTQFIQGTLEDERFQKNERTLVIVCEEGENEYDLSKIKSKNVFIETIDDEKFMTEEVFDGFVKKHNAQRVMIELNGMWQVTDLAAAMPQNWVICQEICFVEAPTFLTYNANMRSLVVDKFKSCELVVFNRVAADTDTYELHKIVRSVSRRADIVYERVDGSIAYDEYEDPLPFDIDADIIAIADKDYAIWYRDLSEEMEKYNGKKVKFKGIVAVDHLPDDTFIIGRHVMFCCAEDIAYRGLVCKAGKKHNLKNRDWVVITAEISHEYHKVYRGKGPVLKLIDIAVSSKPEQEIATFY